MLTLWSRLHSVAGDAAVAEMSDQRRMKCWIDLVFGNHPLGGLLRLPIGIVGARPAGHVPNIKEGGMCVGLATRPVSPINCDVTQSLASMCRVLRHQPGVLYQAANLRPPLLGAISNQTNEVLKCHHW